MTRIPARARTAALCLLFAAGSAGLFAQAPAPAQPATDKDKKDKDKDKAPATPTEQKALEAFQAGKLDEALKLLQAATNNNPAATPPKLTVARWFALARKPREARIMLEQAAADDPSHPEVLLQDASIALAENRLTDAILACNEALKGATAGRFGPEDRRRLSREARLGLIAGYEARNDNRSLEEARAQVRQLLDEDPRNPQFLQKMAVLEFKLGQPGPAQAALEQAFRADPTLDPPELTMANLWLQKADQPKAEAAFKEAVKNHGNPPADTKSDAGKPKAAAAAKVQRAYAQYLLGQGNKAAAKEYLDAAKKIEPDSRETRALEGLMARYNKDLPLAGKIFNDLNHQYPSFGFATANLALVLADSPDAAQRKRAVELAQLAFQQSQQSAELAGVFGYCLFKDGRVDEADRVLGQVLATGQIPSADVAYFIALVMESKAKDEDAKKNARRLLTEVLKASKGGFVYRTEAEGLLKKLGGPLEEKKDEKKDEKKKEPEKK